MPDMRRCFALLALVPLVAHAEALDEADSAYRDQAFQAAWAAPVGQPVVWRNPVSGNGGSVLVLRERRDAAGGEPCRELLEKVTIDGRTSRGVTTGCRTAQGAWQVVQSAPLGRPADADGADANTEDLDQPSVTAPVPADLPPYRAPPDISTDPTPEPAIPPPVIVVRPNQQGAGQPAARQ